MKPISCLLVDDERHARHLIRKQISACPELQLLGEADRMESARIAIDSVKPEVVFLDIGLRDGDGIDLARMPRPQVPLWVFVSAYEQRAIHAFDVAACDFLTKPVKAERFQETLRRLVARLRPDMTPPPPPVAQPASGSLPPTAPTPPVFVMAGSAGRFLALEDILWIQADRNDTRVRLAGGEELLVRQGIGEWLRSLPSTTFIRVDRSVVVHARRILHAQIGARHARVQFDADAESLLLGRPAASRLLAALKRLGVHYD
ncbi:MAG: LytTR family DNA-binding domain-containing protein [Verrucomicrobiota bacterium]